MQIKPKSTLKINISSANKRVAKNSATNSRYEITCANRADSITYSSSDTSKDIGTISTYGTVSCIVKATDSRGFATPITKQITVYDYNTPVINGTILRENNFETTTKMNINGNYSLVNNKNRVQSGYYRYKEDGGNGSEWTALVFNQSNGTYTCTEKTFELDKTKSFVFAIRTLDKLETYIK